MAALRKPKEKNPAKILSVGMLVWVLLSCLFFKSSTAAFEIPIVTWMFALGGIVSLALGLLSLIWMRDV